MPRPIPTFDIGGFDTAHKLAILTSLAFGRKIDAERDHVEGIEADHAGRLGRRRRLGYRVKLLGVAQRTPHGVEQRVHPTMVAKSSSIAQVMGVSNAVTVDADAVNELTLVGPGAGGMPRPRPSSPTSPTSRAAFVRRPSACRSRSGEAEQSPLQRHEGGYYIRLAARNRPARWRRSPRAWRTRHSLESIVQAAPPGRRRRPRRVGGADHLCDDRIAIARGAGLACRRRPHRRKAAGHPYRAGVGRASEAAASGVSAAMVPKELVGDFAEIQLEVIGAIIREPAHDVLFVQIFHRVDFRQIQRRG